jgi:Pentapeptide repeats (8 copies)
VLLLDCCNSGAFPKGNVARTDEENIHTDQFLKARGRVILTASDAMQYAFEGEDLVEKGVVTSIFSHALIQGLKSGEADIDNDGRISHNDLYKYLFKTVRSRQPLQTPCMWADRQGEILLAQRKTTMIRESPKSRNTEFLIKLLQDGKIEEFNTIRREEDMPLNLRNVSLAERILVGVDLHEVDPTYAILIKSKLGMANLNGAKLIGTKLSDVDLRGANLYGANVTKADLSRADLRAADLKGMVNFTEANLTGADLWNGEL